MSQTPEPHLPAEPASTAAQLDPRELLRVLYDPLAYYPPWQQAAARLGSRQRSSLNAWLIQSTRLPVYQEPDAAQISLCSRLVAGWDRIPVVAHLLACAKQRRRLVGSRVYLAQPAHVHAFLRLPFTPASTEIAIEQDADLLHWGGAYLLHGLRARSPAWLRARMALQFVSTPGQAAVAADVHEELDLTCFWSAWNHAAYLPRPVA